MSIDDDYDYWTEEPRLKPQNAAPALSVETIEGVTPLDTQFGVADPLTVPAVLQDALFGQPAPTEIEIASAGGDPVKVPPLHSYAILDAAKVPSLPEMLEASGMDHRCLFKGDTYNELKDVAPWIVQLEDGNSFTRNLFIKSDTPWHLWGKEPGIYVRSRGTLDDLWKHFRKFTKIKDGAGKWYYWRFWEPKTIAYYLDGVSASQERLQQIFIGRNGVSVSSIVASSAKEGTAAVLRFSPSHTSKSGQCHATQVVELDARYTEGFLEASIALLRKYAPELNDKSDHHLMWLARQNIQSFHQFNLVSKPVIANTLAIIALCGHALDRLPDAELGLLRDKGQSQFRRTSILLQQVKQRVSVPHG